MNGSKTYRFLIVFLLFFALIQTSCVHIPCELNSDLEQVDHTLTYEDLIGTYIFDETSINYALGKEAKSSKLILNRDGTLEIKDFPTKVFTYEKYDVQSYKQTNAKGTWEFNESKSQKAISLYINFDINFLDIRNKSFWMIFSKDNEIVLYNLFGDIDACSAARLLKIE